MAQILHIIHELSLGGAARSMIATAKYSSRQSGNRHAVLSLVPPSAASMELAREAGIRVVSGSDPQSAHAEMAAADIVQIHWWNVPEMHDLMSGRLPPMRLMLFYHVAGDGVPHIITPALRDFADLNVPCNPYSHAELPVFSRMDPQSREDKVAMVYDAADFARLDGLERRPHQEFNVGYIGTVDFVKMHPRYVEMSAAVRVPESRFIVCGGGGSIDDLKSRAAASGQAHRFDFRGYVDDIRSVIGILDIYGYPLCEDTYAAAELNLQEVMHAGIPPVVFPYGGVRSLVSDGETGLVVRTEAEYAQAVEHLFHDPGERRRLGANAAAYARRVFGAENAAVKMDHCYRRMLGHPKRVREWPGTARASGEGAAIFIDTLGDYGKAYRVSRQARTLAEAWEAESEIARSSRLAFQSGILAYRGRYPGDPYLRFWAGLNFATAGKPDDATLEFAGALKAGFPHWRVYWNLAQSAEAAGRSDLARQALDLLENMEPGFRMELDALQLQNVPAEPALAATGASVLTGVNLIGYPSSNIGLGAAARNTLAMLQDQHVPVSVFDLDAGGGRSLHETYFRRLCVATADQLPHEINLWHMNPPEVVHLMNHSVPKFDCDRFNICVPFWELSVLPDAWLGPLEAMDLVLAPTRFIEGNLAAAMRTGRVRYFRQPLQMPDLPRMDRETWGIPSRDVVFISSFDCGSDVLRKNPSGTIAAFRKHFLGKPGVQLILKWVNQDLDASTRRAAEKLREEIGGQANIRIIDRSMPYPEVLALYRAADVFVSLHRAEGLGLGLMECMALGKPVIGTGWSGNMDFMSESNSCLVGHGLVPIPAGSAYDRMLGGKTAQWAEPDLDEAAAWMLKLASDPGLRRSLGARAEADIREYSKEARRGAIFDDIKALWNKDRAAGAPGPRKAFDIPLSSPTASPGPVAGIDQPKPRISEPSGSRSPAAGPVPDSGRILPVRSPPSAGPESLPLHLRRLASLGLLTPKAGGPNAAGSKVTAIVSTYNSECFIRGCLQNLVEQTLFAQGRLEIVIIDSGSPQGEGAVAAEYRDRHPGIVYVRTERETLYAAWNRAVKASTGTYLVNSNTDDRHRPDAFERLATALDSSYVGLVYGDAILTEGENETWARNTASRSWLLPDFSIRQALVDCPFGCVVMWRKNLHDELGFFDPGYKIAGDYEFFLKAAILRGALHLKEPLALYYESQKNLSYGNQPLVDKEVDAFLRVTRVETPLETIYPFLRVDASGMARLAATMDFAAVLLHPLARRGPVEALTRLLAVMKEVGMVPELVNNMSMALMILGQKEEAKGLMKNLMAEDSSQAGKLGLGTPEGDWVPTKVIRVDHPGLRGMPDPVFSHFTRVPLAGHESTAWTAGRRPGS